MIAWTDYMRYRARARGFDLAKIEHLVRYSSERYFDTETGRQVVVGRHGDNLVMIPYDFPFAHFFGPKPDWALSRDKLT